MFLFAIPMWLKVIFFLIGNGPTIFKLIREIKGLMSGLSATEQKEVMESCKEELEHYKRTGEKQALMHKIKTRKESVIAKREERKRRRRERKQRPAK